MSAPGRHTDVATRGGTEASPTADSHATPWGCTRLFELRHHVSENVPAQVSRYAASLIRSDILTSDMAMSPRDRQSCELTRQVPSTLATDGRDGQLPDLAQLGQGQVEEPPPQFVGAALGQRFGELADPLQAQAMLLYLPRSRARMVRAAVVMVVVMVQAPVGRGSLGSR